MLERPKHGDGRLLEQGIRRREISLGLTVTTVMNRLSTETKIYFIHKGEEAVLVKFLTPKKFFIF